MRPLSALYQMSSMMEADSESYLLLSYGSTTPVKYRTATRFSRHLKLAEPSFCLSEALYTEK